MNEQFKVDLYCGEVINSSPKSLASTEKPDKITGWIAITIDDEKLKQYNGHNIKIKVEVVEDLGVDKAVFERAEQKRKRGQKCIKK